MEGDKPASIEAATKPAAERVHKRLDEIAPKQIVGATKKQLLIANASGVVTAVTASGDVTNDESGAFSIGDDKLATEMYQDKSVTAPKLAALPGARVKRTGASVNITNRGDFKPLNFDAEDWDNGGMHSLEANTSRLVCITAGVYIVQGLVQFSGPAGTETSGPANGDRVAALVKNGTPAAGPIPGHNLTEFSVPGRTADPVLPGSGGNAIALSTACQMSPGDFVELWVWQNSGETLKILSGDSLHEPFLSAVFQHSL